MNILIQTALGVVATVGVTVAVTSQGTPAPELVPIQYITAAQEFPTCVEAAAVIRNINAQHPVVAQATLNPEQTKRVIAWYNALEPVTDTAFDLAIVLRHANGRTGLLVGIGGEVCESSPVPEVLVPAMLRAIAGNPA